MGVVRDVRRFHHSPIVVPVLRNEASSPQLVMRSLLKHIRSGQIPASSLSRQGLSLTWNVSGVSGGRRVIVFGGS